MASLRQTLLKAKLNFLTVRLAGVDMIVATELIRRKCFRYAELHKLHNILVSFPDKWELCNAIDDYLTGRNLRRQPAWTAALAITDRQLAIHAVVNAGMTDEELERLEKLSKLQRGGHMLRQLQVAIELEQNRRRIGGKRSSRHRITTRRG